MSTKKVMKIITTKFQEFSDEKVYNSMTDFRPFTKIVNSFLEHNLEAGQIFRDSGLAQYGQERLYKSKELLVITRTTRTFAFVTSDWGPQFKLRVFVNEQGPFLVRREGVRYRKPLNY